MMFAQGENLDIFDNDQLIVIFMKHCPIHQIADVLLVALGEKEHGFGISFWRTPKSFTLRIFAYTFEDRLDCAS